MSIMAVCTRFQEEGIMDTAGPLEDDKSEGAQGEDIPKQDKTMPVFGRGLARAHKMANARFRILHYENAFGDTYTSEYCLDGMSSLVLTIVRNSKFDEARLARIIASSGVVGQRSGESSSSAAAG